MNDALDRLADELALADAGNERLRLEFGYACALRIRHLLEEPEADECLLGLGAYLAGPADRDRLNRLAGDAARLANRHPGSKSIDGCGHAAVSATCAVARAIEGKALEAASYAAYAAVYAQGGYAAVADRESFEPEHRWQVSTLAGLAGNGAASSREDRAPRPQGASGASGASGGKAAEGPRMSTEAIVFDGGCTCRALRYRMVGAPLFVHCCHCRWCQRETGASFALNALIESDRVELLQGEVAVVDTPSNSGRGQRIARCPTCQVAVWSHYGGAGDAIRFVRVGTLDEPDRLPPDIHIFTASKQPWVVLPPGTPAVPEYYKAAEHWPQDSLDRRAALLARSPPRAAGQRAR